VQQLVWLLMLAPLLAQGVDVAAAVKEARDLIDRGQASVAVEKLTALHAADDARVQQALGVAYYHADDYGRSVDLLQRVRERLPDGSVERRETEQVLGLALHLLGRDADAIPWLEKTRAWAADNLELNFVLGQAYIQTSQPDRAREALARTFGVAADAAAARVLTAQLAIRLQMEPLAEAELIAALKQDPRVSHANFLLGQLALFRGKLDEALAYSRKEIAINPADAMAFYQAGDALVRQGKWDEAVRTLQQSLWINPFYSGPYILLGRAYMKQAQPATAEAMLRRAIEFDPNNRMAHYLLAQVLQQTGRDEDAKREFGVAERLQGQPGRP
jgi:tetratricopeptide (TPR) repeat protein